MAYTHLAQNPTSSLGLFTDLYQITMAYGYWKRQMYDRPAIFNLFFRKAPFGGTYAIASGLALVMDYLNQFKFSVEDIQYLGQLKGADGQALFDESFLNYLQRLEFKCTIKALPEGSVCFPQQPILRVEGPILQCQLIETALLNLINFSTLISTKANRIVQAAGDDPVLEFGLRRAQGFDGGLTASRAAYIGGCAATSNVLAGRLYHIPVKGTHAHSWVMAFEEEQQAFQAYAEVLPNNCILLVDTYDTLEGVKNAIEIGRELKSKGYQLLGIRLDSGDLGKLSQEARQLLDEAGFKDTTIVASNDLDEYRIKELKDSGAKINVWGVGTRLATAFDQPALGGVYKLAAIKDDLDQWQFKIKFSDDLVKTSTPGALQIRRYYDADGFPAGDAVFNELQSNNSSAFIDHHSSNIFNFEGLEFSDLLQPIYDSGQLVYAMPTIHETRNYCLEQIQLFSNSKANPYPFGLEARLHHFKAQILRYYKT